MKSIAHSVRDVVNGTMRSVPAPDSPFDLAMVAAEDPIGLHEGGLGFSLVANYVSWWCWF